MNKSKQKALEAAGFRFGTVQEFLGLTDEENQLVELQVALSRQTRALREKSDLTQQELAEKLGTSLSRAAKVESGAPGVSLDLMFRGFFALGGKLADLVPQPVQHAEKAKRSSPEPGTKAKPGKSTKRVVGTGLK